MYCRKKETINGQLVGKHVDYYVYDSKIYLMTKDSDSIGNK